MVREDGHFAVRLDHRPMRLPGGPLLKLRSAALAEAIAAEWQAAPVDFKAEDVPLTRIAGTAQECVAPNPEPTIDALLKYGETDLLCYEAEGPPALIERQAAEWEPWLDWIAGTHGARLRRVRGVMPVEQDAAAIAALRTAIGRHGPFALAGLGILVTATGSLVLGLAVAEGALAPDAAHRLAILDELYQADMWGEDAEAMARRRHMARDIEDAARFIRLAE